MLNKLIFLVFVTLGLTVIFLCIMKSTKIEEHYIMNSEYSDVILPCENKEMKNSYDIKSVLKILKKYNVENEDIMLIKNKLLEKGQNKRICRRSLLLILDTYLIYYKPIIDSVIQELNRSNSAPVLKGEEESIYREEESIYREDESRYREEDESRTKEEESRTKEEDESRTKEDSLLGNTLMSSYEEVRTKGNSLFMISDDEEPSMKEEEEMKKYDDGLDYDLINRDKSNCRNIKSFVDKLETDGFITKKNKDEIIDHYNYKC